MARSALLNVMVQAALKAGKSLGRDFGEVQNLQVSVKGPGDFVSTADRKAEKIVKGRAAQGASDLWLPRRGKRGNQGHRRRASLDRRSARRHDQLSARHPAFAVSIALERNGEIVAAVVFNPATDELYTAERGGGAFLNDRRLRVAARRALSDCVIGCGVPALGKRNHGKFLVELRHVMGEVAGIRRLGSPRSISPMSRPGVSTVSGKRGLLPWDMAAGILLIREAGGFATDWDGGATMLESGTIVAGNEIYPQGADRSRQAAGSGQVTERKSGCCKVTVFSPAYFNSAQCCSSLRQQANPEAA